MFCFSIKPAKEKVGASKSLGFAVFSSEGADEVGPVCDLPSLSF